MNLNEYSITQLADSIKKNKLSPDEVFNYFLKRINKHNDNLNVFLAVNERHSLNKDLKDTPLYGIPFSMKDTYATSGIRTSAGSKILEHYIPNYDATVYSRLKHAGAVIVGKTNCDSWGHGSSTENSDYGVTKNPWNTEYVSGGSSGGSAAAMASGLSMFDIGEDTGGSIRLPASFCGVVGLKVTYGLTSRYGCIAYASSLDTVGPLARSVEDIALILEVIAGKDTYDATSSAKTPPKYSTQIQKPIKGMKIGIPKEYFIDGVDKDITKQIQNSIDVFKKMGAEIVDISLPLTKYAVSTYYLIATSETSSNLARYDGIRYGAKRSAFGAETKRRIMLGTFTLSAGYYDAYYRKATKVRTLIKQDFEKAFEKVDVILAPVAPTPAFKIGEKVDDPLQMYLSDIFTIPVNLAGVPSLALPCGLTKNNLPIGFQIIGKHFDESKLLNIGYQFEKETDFFGVVKKGLEKYSSLSSRAVSGGVEGSITTDTTIKRGWNR